MKFAVLMLLTGVFVACEDQPDKVCSREDCADYIPDAGGGGQSGRIFPFGDGPTELRVGNRIVGLGFRSGSDEHVYVFTGATLHEGVAPIDKCGSGGIEPYPGYMAPSDQYGNTTGATVSFAAFRRWNGETNRCVRCDADSCFADLNAFLNQSTGGLAQLRARFDSTTLPPHYLRKGVLTGPQAADLDECKGMLRAFTFEQSQADVLVDPVDEAEVAWQYVRKNTQNEELAIAILPAGDFVVAGLHMKDADLTGATPGAAWCDSTMDKVGQHGGSFVIRTIAFSTVTP
jgi:hypothetical protein